MPSTIGRRALLGAGAALPFLHVPGRAAVTPGALRLGLSSYPPNLTPWLNAGSATGTVMSLIHRGLLSYGSDGKLRGELAERWEADGKDWVFHLRDAVFHNGNKVTAADVKWSLEQVGADNSAAYLRALIRNVERIDTPDARTVRLVMKQPIVTIPDWMANYFMPIVAQNSIERGGPGVGAGPFVLRGMERGSAIDLARFDRYYRPGLPKLRTIRIVAYADENARVAALQAGDVDMIDYVPWQSMPAIEADPKLKLTTQNGPFMYLTFNGRSGPFANALVRQAVGFAVNREDIVRSAFYGRGAPLSGVPLAADSPFYDQARADYFRHDPARAKALLSQAGFANGFSCTLLSTAQYGMHLNTAEVVQQNLAAVGIQATLNTPDWATRVNLGNRGQFEISVNGTAAEIPDPDGLSSVFDSDLPASFIRSTGIALPRLHALFEAGRSESDPAKRRAIYDEVQQIATEQAPVVGLAFRAQGYAMVRELDGFTNLPGLLTFFSPITLEGATLG